MPTSSSKPKQKANNTYNTRYVRHLERENSSLKKEVKKVEGVLRCTRKRVAILETENKNLTTQLNLYMKSYTQAYQQLQQGQVLSGLQHLTPEMASALKQTLLQ